jgi:tetratricopeptide (TPR) repeat protein
MDDRSPRRSDSPDIARSPRTRWLRPNINWFLFFILFLAILAGMFQDLTRWNLTWTLIILLAVMIVGVLGRIGWTLVVRRGVLTWMRLARAPAKAMAKGRTELAEKAFQKAIDRALRFDERDPRRGLMLIELAGFAKNQGRYPQARELFLESIDILEQHRRTHPIDYFVALNNYAIYFIHLRDFQAAQEILERAVDLTMARRKSAEQAASPLFAHVELVLHLNLAFMFIEMRALDEAADHLEEADRIFPELAPKNRARIGDHFHGVRALLKYAQGRFASAAEEVEAARNPDFPTCIRARAKLALVRQEFVQAENLLRRLFDEQRKLGSIHLPELRNHNVELAESLLGQGKPEEALTALQEARAIVADFGLPATPDWRRTLEGWLSRVKDLGRTDVAEALETELRTIAATPEQGITISPRLRVRRVGE